MHKIKHITQLLSNRVLSYALIKFEHQNTQTNDNLSAHNNCITSAFFFFFFQRLAVKQGEKKKPKRKRKVKAAVRVKRHFALQININPSKMRGEKKVKIISLGWQPLYSAEVNCSAILQSWSNWVILQRWSIRMPTVNIHKFKQCFLRWEIYLYVWNVLNSNALYANISISKYFWWLKQRGLYKEKNKKEST